MRLKIQGKEYEFDLDEALQDLDGRETVMLEDYLGGFENMMNGEHPARAVIVQVWLAKRASGEKVTLADVEAIKGLLFGETVEVLEDDPPAKAEGADESGSSQATSADDGNPGLPEETLVTA